MTDIAKICGVSIADIAKINGIGIAGISKVCGINLAAAEFSPPDIDGCTLWLDASQITGKNDGDSVSTWTDLSTSGANVSAANGYPVYKTNILNGLPALKFIPKGPYMPSATTITFRTIITVAKYDAEIFAGYEGVIGGTTQHGLHGGMGDNKSWYPEDASVVYRNGVQTRGGATGAFACFIQIYTGDKSNSPQIAKDRTYSGREWYGYICEVIYYNTALDDTNRMAVEAYLMTKWAL